jgi:hypothetical protein
LPPAIGSIGLMRLPVDYVTPADGGRLTGF